MELTDFGLLTDEEGEIVRDDHNQPVRVATDASTGDRYKKVATDPDGLGHQQREQNRLALLKGGAVYIGSANSDVRGFWQAIETPKPGSAAIGGA